MPIQSLTRCLEQSACSAHSTGVCIISLSFLLCEECTFKCQWDLDTGYLCGNHEDKNKVGLQRTRVQVVKDGKRGNCDQRAT